MSCPLSHINNPCEFLFQEVLVEVRKNTTFAPLSLIEGSFTVQI